MDACATLTFPDNTFDLSVATFVFAGLSDDVAAASHVCRTLKPGGTGVEEIVPNPNQSAHKWTGRKETVRYWLLSLYAHI